MCRDLLNRWQLPMELPVGDKSVPIRGDFRQVLQVLDCLNDDTLPLFARWRKALRLFYRSPIPPEHRQQAMEQLAQFITCGQPATPGPKLLDWNHDAPLIISGVNLAAGRELRQEEFVHWWTFLGFFHAMAPGTLSEVVAIRDKIARGVKLDAGQQQFYRQNRDQIRLPDSKAVQEEKRRLEAMLKGG